ncbi:MAG: T9SS type A sorting domain-containing protein [Bacteroidetes bacterium]|jgi:endonuclease I|nr:T9SS type A sorting domain-containing protein [Bacteroidota bacterium]
MIRQWVSILFFLAFLGPVTKGQGHQPVFPDLEGFDLELAVRQTYRPTDLMEYGEARDTLYKVVEAQNDSVRGIYTRHAVYLPPDENPRQAIFRNGAADGINAEHTWPRSKGSRNNLGERDMHHLRPAKVSVNADRANFPFAKLRASEISTWYYRDEQTNVPPVDDSRYSKLGPELFEPRDAVKGDIARGMMYFYTVYRPEAVGADPAFFDLQRTDLCEWHLADPVDEAEWNRTYKVAQYQEDKPNPFVMDCTLAHRLYCSEFEECDPVSSSADAVVSLNYSVFPSPAKEQIIIELVKHQERPLPFAIFSSQGRQMMVSSIEGQQKRIDLQNWPKGVYFIQFRTGNRGNRLPVQRFSIF